MKDDGFGDSVTAVQGLIEKFENDFSVRSKRFAETFKLMEEVGCNRCECVLSDQMSLL